MRYLLLAAIAATASPQPAAQDLYDISKIKTIEVTAPSNWRTVMANNYASKTVIKVDVKIDGKVYKEVGARHRGFSTYRFLPQGKTDKRPWKLLFDEYIDGQKAQGYRTLNINNNVWDPSFMREVVTFEYMRRFVRAPKSCFVKLKVNGEDLGLFTNTQQINKDFLQEHYRDDEGNRYRGDRPSLRTSWNDTALTWLGTSVARYKAAYELKTENGKYQAWTKLINACNVLNNTTNSRLPIEIPKVIDIDAALRFIAVANSAAWLDSYLGRTCKNFYLYEDPFHGQFTLQPWDVNNAFGGLTDGLGSTGIARLPVMYREFDTRYPRPLFSQLVKVPKWRAAYLAHMRSMLPQLDWRVIGKRIEALRTFIRPHLQADSKRLYTMQQFDANVTRSVFVGLVTAPGLKPFFEERFRFLSSESNMARTAPTLSQLAHSPAQPQPTQGVTVTTKVSGVKAVDVTLHYRVRGPFVETPMFDDGKHGDGAANDGIYGAQIPPQPALSIVEYYVSANSDLNTSKGAMAILPSTGSLRPHSFRVLGVKPTGPIIISEVLAKNDSTIKDAAGEFDDYIELTNVSQQAVSVSGMYLTDNASNPTKWKIPAQQTIAAGGTLLIWADNDTLQGPLHASFKLSASGEEVALFASDGKTNLDWLAFGPQLADRSTGRLPGLLDRSFGFPDPTPNAVNEASPCGHSRYVAADTTVKAFGFAGQGKPALGQSFDLVASSAPANAACVLLLGLPQATPLPGIGTLLLNPPLPILGFASDASGSGKATIAVPRIAGLGGARVYFQTLAVETSTLRLSLSGGVATRICP